MSEFAQSPFSLLSDPEDEDEEEEGGDLGPEEDLDVLLSFYAWINRWKPVGTKQQ